MPRGDLHIIDGITFIEDENGYLMTYDTIDEELGDRKEDK